MSYEELKEHNIFLPEEEWGKLDLSASVNLPALVGAFVLAIVSCVLMVIGGGGLWTWVGAAIFVVFMFSFMIVSNAGIERQNRHIDELHQADTSRGKSGE